MQVVGSGGGSEEGVCGDGVGIFACGGFPCGEVLVEGGAPFCECEIGGVEVVVVGSEVGCAYVFYEDGESAVRREVVEDVVAQSGGGGRALGLDTTLP